MDIAPYMPFTDSIYWATPLPDISDELEFLIKEKECSSKNSSICSEDPKTLDDCNQTEDKTTVCEHIVSSGLHGDSSQILFLKSVGFTDHEGSEKEFSSYLADIVFKSEFSGKALFMWLSCGKTSSLAVAKFVEGFCEKLLQCDLLVCKHACAARTFQIDSVYSWTYFQSVQTFPIQSKKYWSKVRAPETHVDAKNKLETPFEMSDDFQTISCLDVSNKQPGNQEFKFQTQWSSCGDYEKDDFENPDSTSTLQPDPQRIQASSLDENETRKVFCDVENAIRDLFKDLLDQLTNIQPFALARTHFSNVPSIVIQDTDGRLWRETSQGLIEIGKDINYLSTKFSEELLMETATDCTEERTEITKVIKAILDDLCQKAANNLASPESDKFDSLPFEDTKLLSDLNSYMLEECTSISPVLKMPGGSIGPRPFKLATLQAKTASVKSPETTYEDKETNLPLTEDFQTNLKTNTSSNMQSYKPPAIPASSTNLSEESGKLCGSLLESQCKLESHQTIENCVTLPSGTLFSTQAESSMFPIPFKLLTEPASSVNPVKTAAYQNKSQTSDFSISEEMRQFASVSCDSNKPIEINYPDPHSLFQASICNQICEKDNFLAHSVTNQHLNQFSSSCVSKQFRERNTFIKSITRRLSSKDAFTQTHTLVSSQCIGVTPEDIQNSKKQFLEPPNPPFVPLFQPPPPPPPPPPPLAVGRPNQKMTSKKSSMRQLYWKKITIVTEDEKERPVIVWTKLVKSDLNLEELNRLFTNTKKKKKKSDDNLVSSPKKARSKKILQHKRSQAIAIFLSSLRIELEAIRQALLDVDTDTISIEAIEAIYKLRPKPGELEEIKRHVNAQTDLEVKKRQALDKPEQFLIDLWGIPYFSDRIYCVTFTSKFNYNLGQLIQTITVINRACKELRGEGVLTLISIILQVGNHLNEDSESRGNANGFGLDILAKLKDVKSQDNSTHLLAYITRTYLKSLKPQDLSSDTPSPLPSAADMSKSSLVNYDEITTELESMHVELQTCKQKVTLVLEETTEPPSIEFGNFMKRFFAKAFDTALNAKNKLKSSKEIFCSLLEYFSVETSEKESMSPTDFFNFWIPLCREMETIWPGMLKKAIKAKKDL